MDNRVVCRIFYKLKNLPAHCRCETKLNCSTLIHRAPDPHIFSVPKPFRIPFVLTSMWREIGRKKVHILVYI